MINVNEIKKDFPIFKHHPELIYFDNAATTFKPQVVIDRVRQYYESESVNIHRGDYDLSFSISQAYDAIRSQVADFLKVSAKEIVFTSGASESLNMIAYGYGMTQIAENDVILTTEAEHASSILPWFNIVKKKGAKIEYIPMSADGKIELAAFEKALHDKVKVVVIAHVSNVLGYINPIKEISALAHKNNAIVVCDGAQSVAHMPIDLKELDVDFFAFSAHKMLGPTGVGVLYGKYDLLNALEPIMFGGGSNARFNYCGDVLLKNAPDKFESGTRNIEGVLGFGEALTYLNHLGMENIMAYEQQLHQYLMQQLKQLDNIEIYNPNSELGITAFNVKNIFAQDAAHYLGKHNICLRAGHHCAKILLEVLNTSETLRASLYFYNTFKEIDTFIDVLKDITLEKTISLYV